MRGTGKFNEPNTESHSSRCRCTKVVPFGGWVIFRRDWDIRFGISFAGALGLGVGVGANH